ncbi:MAG: hypothetical protein MJZ76_00720 [Bacteroidales bacterium]|nr:hypothetical protein [Bacteroidales bacterium]
MKNFKILSICLLSALLLFGCGMKKMIKRYPEMTVKLENTDLENKGGKVEYKIVGTVPAKYMRKKATMTITPMLEYNGETIALEPIQLQGEKAKAKGTVIPFKAGGQFTSTGSFDYKDQYEEAILVAESQANLRKKSHLFEKRKLGEGISNTCSRSGLTPTLKEKSDAGNGTNIVLAEHQYKQEYVSETGVVYFEVNKSDLNMNLKLNKDQSAKDAVQKFMDFVAEGRVVEKMTVTGWASPEGEESSNQDLSLKRTEQGKKWFEQQFEKYQKKYAKEHKMNYKDMPKPQFAYETKASGEDWSGFEKAVEKSNIAEKNQILNVVRSQSNSAMREQKIREMTDIYNEIKDAILPPLRRVEVTMRCNKNNFNDEQIAAMAKSNPDTLNLEELLYAAYMTKDAKEKMAIYTTITETEAYQKDWRAYNNLASMQLDEFLKTGNNEALENAKSNLEKANAVDPSNGIILNNMGIAEYLSGNKDAAMDKFRESEKATKNPISQSYNLALTKITEGDYAGARQMMNNKNCDYNMALAYVLEKNYDSAKSTLDCIADKDAKVYYLQAVLSSRLSDEEGVYSNLKEAIARDASYKATARKDAEFKKYKRTSQFQSLIN